MDTVNKRVRRRIELTPEQIAQVEAMAGFLSVEQIVDFLGIDDQTFRNIQKRQPEVRSAYKKGRSKAFAAVGRGLLQRAVEGDNLAAIFYAKTQMRWREKDADIGDKQPQTIEVVFANPTNNTPVVGEQT